MAIQCYQPFSPQLDYSVMLYDMLGFHTGTLAPPLAALYVSRTLQCELLGHFTWLIGSRILQVLKGFIKRDLWTGSAFWPLKMTLTDSSTELVGGEYKWELVSIIAIKKVFFFKDCFKVLTLLHHSLPCYVIHHKHIAAYMFPQSHRYTGVYSVRPGILSLM